MCDGMTRLQVLDRMAERIDHHGFTTVCVETEPHDPPWQYTVGLLKTHGLPELVLAGVRNTGVAGGLFPLIVDHLLEEWGGSPPEVATVGARRWGFRTVHGSHWSTDRFSSWFGYHEWIGLTLEPQAIQVFWTDHAGALPWAPASRRSARRRQPRLDRPALPGPGRVHRRAG